MVEWPDGVSRIWFLVSELGITAVKLVIGKVAVDPVFVEVAHVGSGAVVRNSRMMPGTSPVSQRKCTFQGA